MGHTPERDPYVAKLHERFERRNVGRPVPDWQFVTIRLTRCRTVVVATHDDDGKITGYEEVEVCFGFEIVQHPLPGGPIA